MFGTVKKLWSAHLHPRQTWSENGGGVFGALFLLSRWNALAGSHNLFTMPGKRLRNEALQERPDKINACQCDVGGACALAWPQEQTGHEPLVWLDAQIGTPAHAESHNMSSSCHTMSCYLKTPRPPYDPTSCPHNNARRPVTTCHSRTRSVLQRK